MSSEYSEVVDGGKAVLGLGMTSEAALDKRAVKNEKVHGVKFTMEPRDLESCGQNRAHERCAREAGGIYGCMGVCGPGGAWCAVQDVRC